MALYLSLTIKTKALVQEETFVRKLNDAIGKSAMEKKAALTNTMFDQKDDPISLEDAISQAVVAERLGKSRIVYFLQFSNAEAYVFGGNLTRSAESAYKRLMYALDASDAEVSSVEAEVLTSATDQVVLLGRRSTKLSRAKKSFREGLWGKLVPAACTYFIASQIPNVNNIQSLSIAILAAALTLVADSLVAMYREDEWTWMGAQK